MTDLYDFELKLGKFLCLKIVYFGDGWGRGRDEPNCLNVLLLSYFLCLLYIEVVVLAMC